MVRSSADPETLAQQLRAEVQAFDANLPIFDIATLDEVVSERTFGFRIVAVLFTMLGGIALFLACVGIYSVMAFAVGARQREIGIRMALGARGPEIVGLVARTSMVQMTIGLVLGLVGAAGLTQLLSMFMYEVSASDPLTFLMVLVLLAITSVVAAVVPARRASNVDPLQALRSD
jgi:ABC-type antimicrobial peptide transport system permease subunit